MRLRELNKRRTREAIVRVAIGLFVDHGFDATTLVEIANEAGIAPSTLHAYFRVKEDLLFSIYDDVLESATSELLGRDEAGIEVISRWVEAVLPTVLTRYGADLLVQSEDVIRADSEMCRERRFRDALFEDVLAAAFLRDGESADLLRAQVMATIAFHAIKEVWNVWYMQHAADAPLTDLTSLTADHVQDLLEASQTAIESLPPPASVPLHDRARAATHPRPRPARTPRAQPADARAHLADD
jgi:AcrR family transcriptional regulator